MAFAWLQQFEQSNNQHNFCLSQAFDIYYNVYRRIDEKIAGLKKVYLQNVSPKLHSMKNCELIVPGKISLNNQKHITIAGFCPNLEVL